MANIIEISNQAYEARDQAQMEIAAIQQADAKETQEYDEQMVSLGKQLEEDKRRKDMMLRDQARELEEAEEEMRNKSKRGGKWGNAMQEKAQAQASLEKVQSFEEAFNKIKAATGITDIDELVNTFIANEDQNFSLFNYVNEQNNEIEKLEEQMQNLHEEERKYAQESGEDVNQHKKLLNELAQRLKSTEVSAERFEMKYQDALKTINSLKIGIQSIFNKIGCNSSAMSEMLADSMVTEANMMQYLGMIEQRTNEILQLYATVSGPQPEEKGPDRQTGGADRDALVNVLGAGPMTPMGQELIQINPPNLNDYSSEEDSDDDEIEARPLTHEELKLKTMKVIHRRAANNVGKPPRGQQRRK